MFFFSFFCVCGFFFTAHEICLNFNLYQSSNLYNYLQSGKKGTSLDPCISVSSMYCKTYNGHICYILLLIWNLQNVASNESKDWQLIICMEVDAVTHKRKIHWFIPDHALVPSLNAPPPSKNKCLLLSEPLSVVTLWLEFYHSDVLLHHTPVTRHRGAQTDDTTILL